MQEYRDLVALIAANKNEDFNEKMLQILDRGYKPILEKVGLEDGTISQLEQALKAEGVPQGQMLTKTVRFFVKAYSACGVRLSPYITKAKTPKARANATAKPNGKEKPARPRTPKKTPRRKETGDTAPEVIPPDFSRLPIPGIADAFIQYPNGLTEPQCALLDAAIALLRAYVKSQKGGGKREA
jgi:hypothetical protein